MLMGLHTKLGTWATVGSAYMLPSSGSMHALEEHTGVTTYYISSCEAGNQAGTWSASARAALLLREVDVRYE